MNAQQLLSLLTSPPTPQVSQQQAQVAVQPLNVTLPLLIQILENQQVVRSPQVLSVLIFFKNCITSKRVETQVEKSQQWASVPHEIKERIHMIFINFLHNMPSEMKPACEQVCEIIAIIASYDLPANSWSNLVDALMIENVSTHVQNYCIKTLALMLEKIKEVYLNPYITKILQKLTADIYNENLCENKLLGIKNLVNCQATFAKYFEDVFCILTDLNGPVRNEKFAGIYLDAFSLIIEKCYNSIGQNHAQILVGFLLQMTGGYISNLDMMKKILEVFCEIGKRETDHVKTQRSRNILLVDRKQLFELLVTVMGRYINEIFTEDDDEGEDKNNIVYIAQEIFLYMVKEGKTEFVGFALQGVNQLLSGNDPLKEYLGVTLFGGLIEGEAEIKMIGECFQRICKLYGETKDVYVKFASAQTIIKMLERDTTVFSQPIVNYLIGVTCNIFQAGRNDKLFMASCQLFEALFYYLEEELLNVLGQHSEKICSILFNVVKLPNNSLRRKAFEALEAAAYSLPKINQVVLVNKIYQFSFQCVPHLGKEFKAVSYCLKVIAVSVESLAPTASQNQQLMQQMNLGQLMGGLSNFLSNTDTYDSALDCIVAVGDVLCEQFQPYIQPVVKQLFNNFADLTQTEMIIGSCKAIERLGKGTLTAVTGVCQPLLQKLFELLNSNAIDSKAKPSIINAIAGLAYGVGFNNFAQFRQMAVQQIQEVAKRLFAMSSNFDDEDTSDFFQDMSVAILEFFGRIAMKGTAQVMEMMQCPMQLCCQLDQLMCGPHGYIKAEVIYSKICFFLNCLSRLQGVQGNPQGMQMIFNQNILMIVRHADSIVTDIDDYEDLTEPVEALMGLLKQCGMMQ